MKKRSNLKNIQQNPRGLLVLILLFVASIVVLARLSEYTNRVTHISYSTFLKQIELNQIKSVQVSGQEVRGVLRDGKTSFETVVPQGAAVWEKMPADVEVSFNQPEQPFKGWWYLIFIAALLFIAPLLIWFFWRQNKSGGGGGPNIFSMGKSRAKIITPAQIDTTFKDVAGADDAKRDLKDIVDFLRNPEKYRRMGVKIPRGVLLVGEPGNGKTLLAKALAGEANCPFFSVSGSEFVEVFVGVGASRVRDLFAQARKQGPSIVFIDEIDAIGRSRGSGVGGGNDEREQTLNQLLIEMDGLETASNGHQVIVVAATNRPDVLDKALLRPGRFDRRVLVPYPDLVAREAILRLYAQKLKVDPAVDFKVLAESTAAFSGADIANLMNEAALVASQVGHDIVKPEDIEAAREKVLRTHDTNIDTTRMFLPMQVKTKFSDVAGVQEAKEELEEVVDFLRNPAKYTVLGAKLPRGVLLTGGPGNGKTLLAKAVAGEAQCSFFAVSGAEFDEMYVGVGAARVRELFQQARRQAPSIIFIDEIDALAARRDGRGSSNNQTINQLLIEMDGFSSERVPVIILAATNRPDIIDKAVLRPGRIDRQVQVPYPDLASREQILRVHARRIKIDDTIDIKKIAQVTLGFSGADLANLLNEAAIMASKAGKESVSLLDIDEARDKVILGKKNTTTAEIRTSLETKMTAYHEAGHTLISLLLRDNRDLAFYKVTIIPRGQTLGVAYYMEDKERTVRSKENMIADIMTSLGGRAAEELVFNMISSGAMNDFEQATSVARTMVSYYGMSEKLGLVVYTERMLPFSEEIKKQIDLEVRDIIQGCYAKVMTMLKENREQLNKLAETLFEKETLTADEVYELLEIENHSPSMSLIEKDKPLTDAV